MADQRKQIEEALGIPLTMDDMVAADKQVLPQTLKLGTEAHLTKIAAKQTIEIQTKLAPSTERPAKISEIFDRFTIRTVSRDGWPVGSAYCFGRTVRFICLYEFSVHLMPPSDPAVGRSWQP